MNRVPHELQVWPILGLLLGWLIGFIPLAFNLGLIAAMACLPVGLLIAYVVVRLTRTLE